MNDYWGWLVALVSAVLATVATVWNGRQALAAQRLQSEVNGKVAQADSDNNAGELALKMVTDMRPRLEALETYHEDVSYWWTEEHLPRDRMVEREVCRLDPKFQLPPPAPIPRLRRVKSSAA